VTVGATFLTFALVLIGLWPEIDDTTFWRATACVAIVALEGAHASFVLSRRRNGDPASAVAATRVAVAAAAVSGVMGLLPTAGATSDSIEAAAYAQALAIVLVIQLVSTAVAPLLRRLGEPRRPEEAPLTGAERLADEIAAAADRIERIAGHPLVSDECERLRRLAREARAT
jgi:hypothetical protein